MTRKSHELPCSNQCCKRLLNPLACLPTVALCPTPRLLLLWRLLQVHARQRGLQVRLGAGKGELGSEPGQGREGIAFAFIALG